MTQAAAPAPPRDPVAGAAARMVLVTLLWSTAGVVSRHLEAARGFEVTFWRSFFCALTLAVVLPVVMGPSRLAHALRQGGRTLWLSGACWSVMFTAFMLAMTMTRVATVLIVMSVGPLVTALAARVVLQQRLALRTWLAIAAAVLGIAWMFGAPLLQQGTHAWSGRDGLGALVALAVPLAAAANWTVLHRAQQRTTSAAGAQPPSMLPAVLIGAMLSSLMTMPMALPLQATPRDAVLLALLGATQLALPCLMVVRLLRVLPTAQVALIGQLEVLFGVLWAWWFAGESPGPAALQGGAVVLVALAADAWLGARAPRAPDPQGLGPVA